MESNFVCAPFGPHHVHRVDLFDALLFELLLGKATEAPLDPLCRMHWIYKRLGLDQLLVVEVFKVIFADFDLDLDALQVHFSHLVDEELLGLFDGFEFFKDVKLHRINNPIGHKAHVGRLKLYGVVALDAVDARLDQEEHQGADVGDEDDQFDHEPVGCAAHHQIELCRVVDALEGWQAEFLGFLAIFADTRVL